MILINDACLRLVSALNGARGQTIAEYSVVITVVAVGVTLSALFFFPRCDRRDV